MPTKNSFNRRRFIKASAGTVAGGLCFPYIVSSSALGKGGRGAPSERIIVGAIGVGPQGSGVMGNFLGQQDAQVVAVCDVKKHVLANAKNRVDKHYGNSDCRAYVDFREVLGRDDIDVVLNGTCDHWHVLVAIAAAKAGKDMYVEKPLGVSLSEDKALRRAIKRYDRRFQFGTQQRSSWQFRLACELALNEKIGELKTINVWSPGSRQGGSTEVAAVPEWLDYEMWLGPAAYKPYTKDRCVNSTWWHITDYALGFIAGWGVHPLDIAVWGGGDKIQTPLEIVGKAKWPSGGICNAALDWDVTMKYDSGVVMNFTGNPIYPEWKEKYGVDRGHGTVFEGTEGWVHVDRGGIKTYPESLKGSEFGPKDIRLTESNNHVRNLLDCVKTREKTICNIDEGVKADTLCHISDIATRLEGVKLRWDMCNEKFINNETANRYLSRSMRSPWHL